MPILQNTFEGGTPATGHTAGNSAGASGDGFAVTGSGRTYVADAMHGSVGIEFSQANSEAANYAQWTWAADDEVVLQLYVKLSATSVSSTAPIFALRSSEGSVLQLAQTTSDTINVLNAASGVVFSTNTLTKSTWYRFDIAAKRGTTTSNGALKVDYYLGDSLTPVSTGVDVTNTNLGTSDFSAARFGYTATNSSGATRSIRMDSLRALTAEGTTYLGPYGINTPPSITVSAPQNIGSGQTATVTATAGDLDGTIAEYEWTFVYPPSGTPALTGADTASASFTAGSAGSLYLLQCKVTDDDEAEATAIAEVRVPSSGTLTPLPGAGTGSGSWTNQGGAASEGAALSDASNSTYIESPEVGGVEVSRRYRLMPSSIRADGTLAVTLSKSNSGSLTAKVRLFEGSSLRQEWTPTVTTSMAEVSLTLSSGTLSAIGDWGNLYIEFAATS